MILPETYYIEYLFANKVTAKEMQFKCKWKDWPKQQSTWEPLDNILYGMKNRASVMKYLKSSDYNLFYDHVQNEIGQKLTRLHCRANKAEIINERQSRSKINEKINENQKASEIYKKTYQYKRKKPEQNQSDSIENQESQQPTSEQYKHSPSDQTKQLQWSSQIQESEEDFLNKLKSMINQLSYEDQMFIYDEMDYNSKSQIFEYLFQVINLDFNSKSVYTMKKLKLQYQSIGVVGPVKKKEKLKFQNQSIVGPVKKKEKLKPIKIQQKYEQKLQQQSEQQIKIGDFELSMNKDNEILLIQPQLDTKKEYGQIGYDRICKFCSHKYGVIAGAPNQGFQLQLLFEAEFLQKEYDYQPNFQPRNSFVTQKQAQLYEREKYEEYIRENQELFQFMLQEL